jgi:glutathione S-transferase
MPDAIQFYTNPMSRGQIARWALHETGAAYEQHLLDYGSTMKDPAYLAINPMGKVPTIVHDGHVVTECAAICAYLADRFPEAGLAPPPGERGAYYRWLFFGAGPLEAATTDRALGVVVPEEKRRMVGYGSFEEVIDALEGAVQATPYLAGERFTAADVSTGSQIGWGLRFGTIPARPAFEAYVARITARPAWGRAMALDDAAAAG